MVWSKYRTKGLMTVEKIDPPTAVIRSGGMVRVVYKKSRWLDYVGIWMKNRGIMIEAKSTQVPRLQYGDRGIKDGQVSAFRYWGQVTQTVLLWHYKGNLVAIPGWDVVNGADRNVASLKFSDYEKIPAGNGAEAWKIHEALIELFRPTPDPTPAPAPSTLLL